MTCINDFGDCCKHNPEVKPASLFRNCPVCRGEVRGVAVNDALDTTFLPCGHVEPDAVASARPETTGDNEQEAPC